MAKIRLTQDFKEFLNLMNSEKIEYLLIGGYAVSYYGYIRQTKDMDVWIALERENLQRLVQVLVKFGFAEGSVGPGDFTGSQTVFRMGFPPNMIEVITRIAGVDFRDCYQRRVIIDLDGVSVPVIAYEDLKRNKLASGRITDRADIERLEKSKTRRGRR